MSGRSNYGRRARNWMGALLNSPELGESNGNVHQDPGASENGQAVLATQDESLLTDEERIERLLLQEGGRMSQANLIKDTHWSGPTVSRKLIQMEDAGYITRVRVGHENLIFLDGHEPDIMTTSPPR